MLKYLIASLIILLTSCSDSDGVSSSSRLEASITADSLPDMVRVNARKATVLLGTNDVLAKAMERPQMKVSLDYSFSLGKHEVTCSEFNALMKPKFGYRLDCPSDNIPATDLTYYDAVLFANERSKAENFDTAYTYVRAQFDNEKHCINLEGFAFHPEVNAYRLPTEAEWVLVAQKNRNALEGWTAENSDYQLHKVCTEKKSADAVCDMIGNAMEWANDWLGNFRDTVVTNYVGAPDAGSSRMRVVKGGSYRNAEKSIELYNRGDVYTVTSSTHKDYIGFRLAFGAIPEATWMGSDGRVVDSRIVPLTSSLTMRSLMGSYKVKLAFRNDITGNLAYIDYLSGSPVVKEVVDSLDVYHPDISPDGKKVAFCTGLEGVLGTSELYVRELNADGMAPVKLDVESAAIPRWRVLENGDTVIVYVTSAGNNENETSFKSSSTWQVKFANGKFGKPTKLFDGAYHGGVSEDNMLAVTGSSRLRARIADSGKTLADAADVVWYNDEQACNASLAKDSSKRTLFLDFGGEPGVKFVGEKYGTHERMLVADSTGKIVQSVAAPDGYSFDHSEWTIGGKNMAVATLTNVQGAHHKIVLVNLTDSSVVDLVEGDELWHPCLWTEGSFSLNDDILDLDSAGVYFVEGQDGTHESIGIKLTIMWKYKDVIDVLCVGSSRVEKGIIVTDMESGFATNIGHMGNDLNATLYVAENYGVNHLKKLKYIVLSVDIDLWLNRMEFSDQIFTNTPGYVYDANHGFWKDSLPEYFTDVVENAANYSESAKKNFVEMRGFFSDEGTEWGIPLVELDSNWSRAQLNNVAWNLNRLEMFIQKMDSLDLKVVGVIFPQNPRYRETGSWGRYGPTRSIAEEVMESLVKMDEKYSSFVLMDENKDGNHDYSDKMAINTDHLSIEGAKKLTQRLDSLLLTLGR